jgi:hypothetical protein
MRPSGTPGLVLQGYIRGQQYLPIEDHIAQEQAGQAAQNEND